MLRVVIAEDEWLVSFALRRHPEECGCEIVGIATDGDEAVAVCEAGRPDIVLMDIRMPRRNGVEAAKRIMARAPTCIIMLTGDDPEAYLAQAKQAGDMAYLVKPVPAERPMPTMQTALQQFAERFLPGCGAASPVGSEAPRD